MDHAMKMIMSMDLVLIDEWFNDMRTIKYVDGMFFGKDTELYKLKSEPIIRLQPRNSRIANWGKNLMVNNGTLQRLKEYNKYDMILYDFVKKLAYDRQTQFFALS